MMSQLRFEIRRQYFLAACMLFVLGLSASAASLDAQTFTPWSTAVNLGSVINTASTDGCPFVAKDGFALYFASNRPGGYGGLDIYVSRRNSVEEPWGPPQNLGPSVNTASNELCPTLTVDGHRMFLVSDRPGGCGGQDLYVARRQNKRDDVGWEPPVNLGCTINSPSNDFTPSLLETDGGGNSFVLYFSSNRPGGMGGVDIYFSTTDRSGTFGAASPVPELNTLSDDERPNIRKDGLEIFFDSNRSGSLGSTDLWVSTRASTEDPWSPPVNLGSNINTASTEGRPSLSFDGTTLYFMSSEPGGVGGLDLYVSTRTKLHD
jgi:Tol biopolymer transport system component